MKIALAAVLFVLIAGAGVWFYNNHSVKELPEVGESTNGDYSWHFKDAGEDASGAPQTKLTLELSSGKAYDVGTYQGSCATVPTLYTGEISGVLCWWAGGGTELGVFKDGSKFVVKQGEQDEGSAESPGFRGNFKTLFEIK